MSWVYVAFWFDVEDYITPQSNEALKGIIEIFDKLSVRATFKLVGEKLRTLERRERTDIIKLLEKHIRYHTDYHNLHPTPAEYLKGLGWEEGREEFKRLKGKDTRMRSGFSIESQAVTANPALPVLPRSIPLSGIGGLSFTWMSAEYLRLNHRKR